MLGVQSLPYAATIVTAALSARSNAKGSNLPGVSEKDTPASSTLAKAA